MKGKNKMKLGDFTLLAESYKNRTGYSEVVLNVILAYIEKQLGRSCEKVADVGAGTGKLTENLANIGLKGYAVEPNDAMRSAGMEIFKENTKFLWSKGTAEVTELPDNSVDWVLMGSSFHWTDAPVALKEFHRILKPGGFFTAIWNPRDIEKSEWHMEIEAMIKEMVPNLKRVSSGSRMNMKDMEQKLLCTEYFKDLFLIEGSHEAVMTKERYIGAWRSVNDIQAQAGQEVFEEIIHKIEDKIGDSDEIIVPYLSRAFTVQSTKR